MKNSHFYNIRVNDLQNIAEKIYRFMTDESLVNPEGGILIGNENCNFSVVNGQIFVKKYNQVMSKEKFIDLIVSSIKEPHFFGITCVAGTNLDDSRRVATSYMPSVHSKNSISLNFPDASLTGKLNSVEKTLLKNMQ